jgi:hypothetical protein
MAHEINPVTASAVFHYVSIEAEGRRQNLLGGKIFQMISTMGLRNVLIFSVLMSMALGFSQDVKVRSILIY